MRHACIMQSLHDTLHIDIDHIPAEVERGRWAFKFAWKSHKTGTRKYTFSLSIIHQFLPRFRANRETFVNFICLDFLYIEEQNSFAPPSPPASTIAGTDGAFGWGLTRYLTIMTMQGYG